MSLRHSIGACVFCITLGSIVRLSAGEAPDVVRVLHDWQESTVDVPVPEIDGDLLQYSDTHSAHELEAAAELCGPVAARALIQQYSWTATTNDSGDIVLTAVPRDELGRLFFNAVEIEFAAGSTRPRQLRFRDSDNRVRPVAIPVQTARGAGEEPKLLRAADGGIQLTSLTRIEDDGEQTAAPPVADVLVAWESATRDVQRAEIEFARYTYDLITRIEERSTGRIHYEAPREGVYELRSPRIPAKTVSARTDENGRQFAVQSGPAMLYYWDRDQVVVARPDERSYEEFPIPRAAGTIQPAGSFDRLWYSLASPQRALPGTVDVHSEHFIDRFEWSVLKHDERRIILQGWPVSGADQLEISELQVILNPETHLAQATRLVSGDGHQETVHVLKQILINDDVRGRDWRPDLSRYTEHDPAPLAPPAEDEPALLGAPSE